MHFFFSIQGCLKSNTFYIFEQKCIIFFREGSVHDWQAFLLFFLKNFKFEEKIILKKKIDEFFENFMFVKFFVMHKFYWYCSFKRQHQNNLSDSVIFEGN